MLRGLDFFFRAFFCERFCRSYNSRSLFISEFSNFRLYFSQSSFLPSSCYYGNELKFYSTLGKIYEPKESSDKKSGKMEMPIELDLDDDEDDLDEALHEAPEKDLVDLAGILGMHNLLNQSQYYNALKVFL